VLEIRELHHEFAVGFGNIGRQDVGAPSGRTSIKARRDALASEDHAGFRIAPPRKLRLDYQPRVQSHLLVS